jgi:hypothetical protein
MQVKNLRVVKGEDSESVPTKKLQAVLKRNPGFSAFTSVCQHSRDSVVSIATGYGLGDQGVEVESW